MAEGIYSTSGNDHTYARNRFGRKLLKRTPVVSIHTEGVPEGVFSANINTNGTNVIIPSIEGKSIEITSYGLSSSGTNIFRIRSSGTDIFGPINMAANGYISNSEVSIKSRPNEPIVFVSTAIVGGFINYRIV